MTALIERVGKLSYSTLFVHTQTALTVRNTQTGNGVGEKIILSGRKLHSLLGENENEIDIDNNVYKQCFSQSVAQGAEKLDPQRR